MKQLLILMWTYDKLEAPGGVNTVFTLPNGGTFSTALTRNVARPDLVSRRAYSASGSPIYSYDTSFDLLGRPVNATDSQSLARSYLYNRRSELAAATIGTNAFEYAYDTIGNRTVASANSVTNTYAANALNQYTQIDASLLAYDNDGNLTQDDRFVYAYDAENRLISVRPISPTEGALAVINIYDHDNRRVVKRVDRFDGSAWQISETHTFVYDGNNFVLERVAFADGSSRTVEYFWGNDLSGSEQGAGGVGGLLAVSIDGMFYFPCYDQNGNVVCYMSESGTIAAQYVYDPYGNVIDQYGNMPDQFAFGFSTKYLDRETGLIGYQRRFYRPEHGRWLNRDPIEEEGGENLYVFCDNRALDRYDAAGLRTCCHNGRQVTCEESFRWRGNVTVASATWGLGATFLMIDLESNFVCTTCSRYRLHAKAVLITGSYGFPVSVTGSKIEFGNVKPDMFAGSVSLFSGGVGAMSVAELSYLRLGSASSFSFGFVGGAEFGFSGAHGWYVDYKLTEE